MQLVIRTLTEEDLPAADAVVMAAYNTSSRQEELLRYLKLQPNGWFAAVFDDTMVGIGGATVYGQFSYIGMIGVLPTFQRHGIGQAIMEYILTWLQKRGCPTALLDASPAGKPLYERLGFVTDDTVSVLDYKPAQIPSLPPPAPPAHYRDYVAAMREEDLPALAIFDQSRFGAARPAAIASYLADYRERAFVARDAAGKISGYLIAQDKTLGPWVAETHDDAERLLVHALTLPFEGAVTSALVPTINRDAERLLLRYGFHPQRTLTHMRLGDPIRYRDRRKLYGLASFALG